ncbi:hypothetical protein JCM3770_001042 [Rhodotorula araucariae]
MDSGMTGGASGLAQEVQADMDRDCEAWQALIEAQDEFVAALLRTRASLQQRLREAQKATANDTTEKAEAEEKARLATIARLERDTYQGHLTTQEELEKKLANLDAQLAQLDLDSSDERAEPPEASSSSKKDKGPPFALAFINGTVAPFSDKLVQKGSAGGKEASDILRDQIKLDLNLTDDGEVTTLCFLYYDRVQLVSALERHRVISNPSTWKNFVDAFARVAGNFVVDVTNSRPAEPHIAAVLSKFGFMPRLQQIYLAGVHPEHGVNAFVGELDGSTGGLPEDFIDQVIPKVNLVQHLPDHRMGGLVDVTIEFAGLFESSVALPLGGATFAQKTAAALLNRPAPSNTAASRPQEVDPTKGLLNQEPPLCFWHYLSERGCTARMCTRSHKYRLTSEQTSRFRLSVKKDYPCSELRKTGKCSFAARGGTNPELEYSGKDLERRVEVRTADLERAKAAAPPRPAGKGGGGEPVILVPIDGSSAPLSENLSARLGGWRRSGRAEHIKIDEKNDAYAPQPAVLRFVWHNRKALAYNLEDTRVISNDGVWDSSLAEFNSVSNNHPRRLGTRASASPWRASSRLLEVLPRPSTSTSPEICLVELRDALRDLRPDKATVLHVEIVPKLVLNHDPGTDEQGHEDVYASAEVTGRRRLE